MMQLFLEQASSFAGDVDGLVWLITGLVGFWFVLAEGVFFWLLWKFRRKEGQPAQYITGELHSEKRWIEIPHWLIIACDVVIIIAAVRVWSAVKMDPPPPEETVRIVAQQWAWTFVHPGPDNKLDTADDIRVVDELHVLADRTYRYELSAVDVLHSFSVPVFRLKQDAIPGRVIEGWFRATQTGTFDIQCAEICGIGHGIMGARVFIETPEQHQKWMADPSPALAFSTLN